MLLMLRIKKYCLLCCLLVAIGNRFAIGQDIAAKEEIRDTAVNIDYIIGHITIAGNKKTKSSIILREVPFRTGETYPMPVLLQKFEDYLGQW